MYEIHKFHLNLNTQVWNTNKYAHQTNYLMPAVTKFIHLFQTYKRYRQVTNFRPQMWMSTLLQCEYWHNY